MREKRYYEKNHEKAIQNKKDYINEYKKTKYYQISVRIKKDEINYHLFRQKLAYNDLTLIDFFKEKIKEFTEK